MLFTNVKLLDEHYKTEHGEFKSHKCDWVELGKPPCHAAFARTDLLLNHRNQVHLHIYNFMCDVEGCSQGRTSQRKLDTHQRKAHSVYTCDKCQDRSSTSEDALRIHKISHMGPVAKGELEAEAASGMDLLRGGAAAAGAGGAGGGAGELADRIARIRF
jgi:hypothetical protein